MLREQEIKLLTASVDDELTPTQQQELAELLQRSSEARRLLRKLKQDAQTLRAIPATPAPQRFAQKVLKTIQDRQVKPARPQAEKRRAVSHWMVIATAASVLLLVGLASFLVIAAVKKSRSNGGNVVPQAKNGTAPEQQNPEQRNPDKPPVNNNPGAGKATPKDKGPDQPKDNQNPPHKRRDVVINPGRAKLVQDSPELLPKGGSYYDELIAAPPQPPENPDRVELILPTLLRIYQLDKPDPEALLIKTLKREEGTYVELLAKSSNDAFPLIQKVLTAQGIDVTSDGIVKKELENRKQRQDYVFFIENVNPEVLVQALQQLHRLDRRSYDRKRSSAQLFSGPPNLILTPLNGQHRRRLRLMIGTELQPLFPSPGEEKTEDRGKVDARQPLAVQTGKSVEDAVKNGRPAKKSTGTALAMVYRGSPSRHKSTEVIRFLKQRKPKQDGTVQVMLVLRTR